MLGCSVPHDSSIPVHLNVSISPREPSGKGKNTDIVGECRCIMSVIDVKRFLFLFLAHLVMLLFQICVHFLHHWAKALGLNSSMVLNTHVSVSYITRMLQQDPMRPVTFAEGGP